MRDGSAPPVVVLAVALIGSTQSGVQVHVIDIGGAHTGTIYAVMNTAAQLPGVAAPSIVGYYVQRFGSVSGYAVVFWIAIALYVGGTIAFGLAPDGPLETSERTATREASGVLTPSHCSFWCHRRRGDLDATV